MARVRSSSIRQFPRNLKKLGVTDRHRTITIRQLRESREHNLRPLFSCAARVYLWEQLLLCTQNFSCLPLNIFYGQQNNVVTMTVTKERMGCLEESSQLWKQRARNLCNDPGVNVVSAVIGPTPRRASNRDLSAPERMPLSPSIGNGSTQSDHFKIHSPACRDAQHLFFVICTILHCHRLRHSG